MKKIYFLLLSILSMAITNKVYCQEQELEQLALDIEKLNQLRSILNEMYQGYQTISKGYNTIKDLSQGNFDLHKLFLDGLLNVSPVVKSYARITDIIASEQQIVKEYKFSLSQFKSSKVFSKDEINYLDQVYTNLFNRSLKNLDELLMISTDSELRMNDAERLNAIDNIYYDIKDKLTFLRRFSNNANAEVIRRQKELQRNQNLQNLLGTHN